ncbi:MAG: hypothetical protein HOD92_01040 [Deltaproteobacteria bacterium]|jgi:hypothetical protein|nr:hypothetical protein [Deltaproteobacteria bacterium]MBT4525489.1 hypothetical protein [Deltaproteobacteria bacterium]
MRQRIIVKFLLLTMIVSALFLSSCKEFSNDEGESKTISVDLGNILQQLNTDTSLKSIDAPSVVKGLLIGAIVVTARTTPYTSDTVMTQTVEDELVTQLTNSISYITIANLPVSGDYINFLIPPDTAANWQVVVVATDFAINTLGDLASYDDAGHKLTHKGFTPRFFTSDTVGNDIIQVDMELYD